MDDTITVYTTDDSPNLHLEGTSPEMTACLMDTSDMVRQERPSDWAGLWCGRCLRSYAADQNDE